MHWFVLDWCFSFDVSWNSLRLPFESLHTTTDDVFIFGLHAESEPKIVVHQSLGPYHSFCIDHLVPFLRDSKGRGESRGINLAQDLDRNLMREVRDEVTLEGDTGKRIGPLDGGHPGTP